MDDYISREKAVAELYKLSDNMIKAGHHQMALGVNDSIVLVGELMPSIDAVPQWIPCSERLPEEGIGVVTVDKDGDYEINHIIDEEDGEWFWEKPVAWMPLPKPPKGDEECRR